MGCWFSWCFRPRKMEEAKDVSEDEEEEEQAGGSSDNVQVRSSATPKGPAGIMHRYLQY